MAHFDWYQGTVRRPENDVMAALEGLARGSWEFQKAPHGYAREARLVDGAGVVAKVWTGGAHSHPHVVLSGEWAQPGADLLRSEFADCHTVSRLDAAEDRQGPTVFDSMQSVLLRVAASRGVMVDTKGDHLLTKQGRTVYLGSPKSHVRLRQYDKTAELVAKLRNDPVRLLEVPPDVVRLEVQVRPAKAEAKAAAATLQPVDVFGASSWTREIYADVVGVMPGAFKLGTIWRASDHERAVNALLAQYCLTLQRMHEECGSWPCVGLQLGDLLAAAQDAKAKARH